MMKPLGYRCYLIGGDGHIRDRLEFVSTSLSEARARAAQFAAARNFEQFELWQASRLLFYPGKIED